MRAISLISCVAKVAESMWLARASEFLLPALSPSQSGFRPAYSTVNTLQDVCDFVHRSLHETGKAAAVLYDFQNAFDRCSHLEILLALSDSLPRYLLAWYDQYLKNRCAKARSAPRWKVVKAGVPQGAPSSPLVFAAFAQKLLDRLQVECPSLLAAAYADDLTLVARGESWSIIEKDLVNATRIVQEWC